MDAWLSRGPADGEAAARLAPAAAPISNMAAPASRARPWTCTGSPQRSHQRVMQLGIWRCATLIDLVPALKAALECPTAYPIQECCINGSVHTPTYLMILEVRQASSAESSRHSNSPPELGEGWQQGMLSWCNPMPHVLPRQARALCWGVLRLSGAQHSMCIHTAHAKGRGSRCCLSLQRQSVVKCSVNNR